MKKMKKWALTPSNGCRHIEKHNLKLTVAKEKGFEGFGSFFWLSRQQLLTKHKGISFFGILLL